MPMTSGAFGALSIALPYLKKAQKILEEAGQNHGGINLGIKNIEDLTTKERERRIEEART